MSQTALRTDVVSTCGFLLVPIGLIVASEDGSSEVGVRGL